MRLRISDLSEWPVTVKVPLLVTALMIRFTSHRAVTTVNANVASKVPKSEGRASNAMAKAAWVAET